MELSITSGACLSLGCHREDTAVSSYHQRFHASTRGCRRENSTGTQREILQIVSFHVKSRHGSSGHHRPLAVSSTCFSQDLGRSSRISCANENVLHRRVSDIRPGPIRIPCRSFFPHHSHISRKVQQHFNLHNTPQIHHDLSIRVVDPGDRNTHSGCTSRRTREHLHYLCESACTERRHLPL